MASHYSRTTACRHCPVCPVLQAIWPRRAAHKRAAHKRATHKRAAHYVALRWATHTLGAHTAPLHKGCTMAKHKRTSTHVLHAAAQVAAARAGHTQWPNATVAKFNAKYTYSIQQGTTQRLHCKAQQAPPIVASAPSVVRACWPAAVVPSKRYAVSAPQTAAARALVKAALAPTHRAKGGCTVGYNATIAGNVWHYCLRTHTFSCKALGVSALSARQVRRSYGQAMAQAILAIAQ